MKMHVLTVAVLTAIASQAVLAASEGADTWSAVEPVQKSMHSVLQPVPRADSSQPDRTDTKYVGRSGGSEGGDTWSHFVPQFQSQPTGSAGLASAHKGSSDYWQPPFGE